MSLCIIVYFKGDHYLVRPFEPELRELLVLLEREVVPELRELLLEDERGLQLLLLSRLVVEELRFQELDGVSVRLLHVFLLLPLFRS